ncbi:MAG TPA: chromate transporter [Rhodocyclaceae bacterium]|jgi:chromate transporter
MSQPSPPLKQPSLFDLFIAFQTCALHAFGGVLPFARRELVEKRGWLTEQEFTETLGLCQFLPGPNISNLSIAVGKRFGGLKGATAAFVGLYGISIVIVLGLAMIYGHYGKVPALQGALNGIAAVAAGLILSMALKMALPQLKQRRWLPPLFMALTFIAIGLLRLPLLWALPLLAAGSIWLADKSS